MLFSLYIYIQQEASFATSGIRSVLYRSVMEHFNMTSKDRKHSLLTFFVGILFLATYFLRDELWDKIWLFSVIPLTLLGMTFLALFIFTIISKNRKGILIGIAIIGVICLSELITSELFKSKRILEATLMDDLSAIRLTLRADNRFEVVSSNMFDEEVYKGNYSLEKNKIIFKDKRYNNDFIPDTLTILGDKIIIRFDNNGEPITDFATYFDIKKNEIYNAP